MSVKVLNNGFLKGKKIIFISTVLLSIFGFLIDIYLYGNIYDTFFVGIELLSVIALCAISIIYFVKKEVNFIILQLISSWVITFSVIIANIFFVHNSFSVSDAQLYCLRGVLFVVVVSSITALLGKWKHLLLQIAFLISTVIYLVIIYDYSFLLNNILMLLTVGFGFGSVISFFGIHINSFFEELKKSNTIIEAKNKELTESIVYAKGIQSAILPSKKKIEMELPNSAFLYIPKDIVAGDFYYVEKKDDKVFFAVADATGHGVPGALVSIVCSNALNRVLRETNVVQSTDRVLNQSRIIIINELNQNNEGVNDGMDIGLCSIHNDKLEFSGANISMWVVFNDELFEYKGDRQPIGKYYTNSNYTLHSIDLKKGQTIYITSDGFYDQFGGENYKKYKVKRLKDFLVSINRFSVKEQEDKLKSEFNRWKGDYDQIDDVCMLIYKV